MTKEPRSPKQSSIAPARGQFSSLARASEASDMPETAAPSKRNNPAPRLAAAAKLEAKLPRCLHRRPPCAQSPSVRHHPRPSPYRCADHRAPKRPYRLAIGVSVAGQTLRGSPMPIAAACKSPAGGFLPIGTPRCKKSLSMVDLTLPALDSDVGIDLKSESGSTVGRFDDAGDRSRDLSANSGSAYCSGRSWTDATPSSESEQGEIGPAEDPRVKAASVVRRVLMLNAWRRRRAEIAQLEQQVEHLHLQIEFLRRLLVAENDRVGRLNGELQREKSQSEEAARERDAAKSEKEKLEGELKRLEEISQERSVTAGNLRNELLTARDQLQALEAQMAKDREKFLKLREDKRILLDKVSAGEARGARADKAESAVKELQARLATQAALAESTQEQLRRLSRELQITEAEKQKLEKRFKSSESNGRTLSLRVASLESQLADRDAALRRIELEYNSRMTELAELRERLLQQSQEGGWKSRMLQLAGRIMRASIARPLEFLFSSALPL